MKNQFDIALSFATEDQALVGDVYQYLKAEGYRVFFAPSQEGQVFLSGKNQRQVFYQIFGMEAKYVALFVTKSYIAKTVPMEEARIAITKRAGDGTVIPIYLDGTPLPSDLLDPKQTNYYSSDNAIEIAVHLGARCRQSDAASPQQSSAPQTAGGMHISNNTAEKQVFIDVSNGPIYL